MAHAWVVILLLFALTAPIYAQLFPVQTNSEENPCGENAVPVDWAWPGKGPNLRSCIDALNALGFDALQPDPNLAESDPQCHCHLEDHYFTGLNDNQHDNCVDLVDCRIIR